MRKTTLCFFPALLHSFLEKKNRLLFTKEDIRVLVRKIRLCALISFHQRPTICHLGQSKSSKKIDQDKKIGVYGEPYIGDKPVLLTDSSRGLILVSGAP